MLEATEYIFLNVASRSQAKEMIELLSVYQKEKRLFGDVYVKFTRYQNSIL